MTISFSVTLICARKDASWIAPTGDGRCQREEGGLVHEALIVSDRFQIFDLAAVSAPDIGNEANSDLRRVKGIVSGIDAARTNNGRRDAATAATWRRSHLSTLTVIVAAGLGK